jgi:parallel beta-helix repeat protein
MLLTGILTVAFNVQPISLVPFVPKVQAGLSSGTLADAMGTIINAHDWSSASAEQADADVPHYATVFSVGSPSIYQSTADAAVNSSNARIQIEILRIKRAAEIDGIPNAVSDSSLQNYLSSVPMAGYVPADYIYDGGIWSYVIYERSEAHAYSWAADKTKWNRDGALTQINNIVQQGAPGHPGTYIAYSQTGGMATYYRYYDDTAETLEWFLEVGGSSYLSTCDMIWNFQQNYFWNGQYYGYNGQSGMETEVGPFALISGRYLATEGLLSTYQNRIVSDLNTKLLGSGYSSPLWIGYCVDHVPGRGDHRLENTAGAWAAMEAYYPVMTSTMQTTLQGMGAIGWKGLLNDPDFDASTNMFRWHADESPTMAATGAGLMILFMNGIRPATGSLAMPLNDEQYEDTVGWSPASMFRFNYASRQIRIPVNAGRLDFIFGSGVASYTFPSTGVYTVQFSNDWNTVQSATCIGPLDSEFKYIVASSSPPPTETIYIGADGSIQPPTAPISSVDNVIYTLTDDIAGNVTAGSSAIILQRDNIIIDGAGHTLQGTQASGSRGIELTGRSNVTIKNMKITAYEYGIWLGSSSNNCVSGNNITANNGDGIRLDYSSDNSVSGNNVTNNGDGIYLYSSFYNSVSGNDITANNGEGIGLDYSSDNSVSGNNVTNNGNGIYLEYSSSDNIYGNDITANNGEGIGLYYSSVNNSVSGNTITANNGEGIYLHMSSNNTIYHNNFINNTSQVTFSGSTDVWDESYPSGGNFWSNYNGADTCSGPYQNGTGSDGIGDTPCIIDSNNTDRFPFMEPSGWLNYPVSVQSNVTITGQQIGGDAMNFTASGQSGQVGYVNATMPVGLNSTDISVFIDGQPVQQPFPTITTNGLHYFIYFEFSLSTHDITIQYAVPVAAQTGGGGGRMPYMD